MKFEYETHTDSPRGDVFDWFEHKGSFRRLMPPWEVAEEVRADDTLEDGAQRVLIPLTVPCPPFCILRTTLRI